MAKAKFSEHPFKWLFNIEVDDRQTIGVPLDSDINQENKALRQENASLKAQTGKALAKLKEISEEDKEKNKEQEIIKELNKSNREIFLNRFGQTVSLTKFFREFIHNRKFRESLELTDKDDKEVLSKLGDILVTENGELLVVDIHGNPMSHGNKLSNIIYNPATFGMQLKRGRLLMPYDKDFNPAQYLEDLEVNDVTFDKDLQEPRETTEFRGKVKDLLIQKVKKIYEQTDDIARLEGAITKLNTEVVDLKRAKKFWQNKAETNESELSQALASSTQFDSRLADMHRSNAKLQDYKVILEQRNEIQQQVINKIMSRLEQSDKTLYETVTEDIKGLIEWAKTVVPETVQITPEAPKKEVRIPNPGETIGSTAPRKQ